MRVLLVEDEGICRHIWLKRERFVVERAERPAMAREAALTGSYDPVLLDRTSPDGDGRLSLVAALRAKQPGLPIIVLRARG